MKKIFLSASIPSQERNPEYIKTVDVSAIRDSINGLIKVIFPEMMLVWGGHPAITPLIRFFLQKKNINVSQHVILYQSKFFEGKFPKDNQQIENIILTDNIGNDKIKSLALMRDKMISDNKFTAGVFIGGMEGVEEEFELFKQKHPKALLLPVATTGAAAKKIYDQNPEQYDPELASNYAYMSLFRKILKG